MQNRLLGLKSAISQSQHPPEASDAFAGITEMLATHFNAKLSEFQQADAGISHYVWTTAEDEKVRANHAANDGRIFAWSEPPATGHPGEDFNCHCIARPVRVRSEAEIDAMLAEQAIDPVYPEFVVIPAIVAREYAYLGILAIRDLIRETLFKDPISIRPKGVSKDWVKNRTADGRGYIYKDLKSKGATYVKVSKGDSTRTQPGQQVDNIRIQKDGKSFDKYGNVVPRKSEESHIPLKDFDKYDPRKFK